MPRTLSVIQGDLFGYISPIDGTSCLHPPLCACGSCSMPVERFYPQPAAVLGASILEPWESDHCPSCNGSGLKTDSNGVVEDDICSLCHGEKIGVHTLVRRVSLLRAQQISQGLRENNPNGLYLVEASAFHGWDVVEVEAR